MGLKMAKQHPDALLGSDYDPHAGRAAIRRRAQFYSWLAAGRDPAAFARATEEQRDATETLVMYAVMPGGADVSQLALQALDEADVRAAGTWLAEGEHTWRCPSRTWPTPPAAAIRRAALRELVRRELAETTQLQVSDPARAVDRKYRLHFRLTSAGRAAVASATSCKRCACPCGNADTCGCSDPASPYYLPPGRGINEG